ncbi:hypothetical protein HKCCSP123_06135 [Rhodobacterales bacterium HKCCSP123]|nr:hypothetical protein [Rhodobacterales bacterium HKCCSP123]
MYDLGRIEKTRAHLLADTLEIAVAFLSYELVSQADAIGLLESLPKSEGDLVNVDEPDVDDDGLPDDVSNIEQKSNEQRYVEDAFRTLEYRAACLGEIYPYEVGDEVLRIKSDLSELQFLYLFLLACARTRTFKPKKGDADYLDRKGIVQNISDRFEEVSAACLREMISPHGRVFMFGPNSDDRKHHFGSALKDALPILARTLGMAMAPGWQPPSGASGDGKIDIVGVYDFNDTAEGFLVVVGQCASIEDEKSWQQKRQEADFLQKTGTFHCLVFPSPALFVPAFFRSPNGTWIDKNMVSGVIPIDRLRMLKTLANSTSLPDAQAMLQAIGIEVVTVP